MKISKIFPLTSLTSLKSLNSFPRSGVEGELGSEEETQNRFNELEASILVVVVYQVKVLASGHGLC